MTANLQQLLAASAVIVTLERICASGVLPEADEAMARRIICQACRAFSLATIAERPEEVSAEYEYIEAIVLNEMART